MFITTVEQIKSLQHGDFVCVHYPSSQKASTFLERDGENNLFFDSSGKFIFSDGFILSGKVKIEILDNDEYI